MSDYENKIEIVKTKKQNAVNHKTGDRVIKFSRKKKGGGGRNMWYTKKKTLYPLIRNGSHLAHLSQNHQPVP